MADGKAQRVRITLRWLQIVDNMEAPWDAEGEFRFRIRVTANGKAHETTLPERGHWSISDHPGRNRIEGIDAVLFEGEPGQALAVEVSAFEVDRVSDDDALTPYHRKFTGSPSAWAGRYQPGDEGRPDPEALPEWRLAYDIEVV